VRLLIVRHAIAEDREAFAASGGDDAVRPLTANGARKMRRTARGLHELVPTIDVLVASPLTRAQETAEIIRGEYAIDRIETTDALLPQTALDETVQWLTRYSDGVVAVVGHEPHLGRLVTYLMAGVDRPGVELKKGGASAIDFEGAPKVGGGTLVWSVPPGMLRDLNG
jgi:phosphohistidine phosphatase